MSTAQDSRSASCRTASGGWQRRRLEASWDQSQFCRAVRPLRFEGTAMLEIVHDIARAHSFTSPLRSPARHNSRRTYATCARPVATSSWTTCFISLKPLPGWPGSAVTSNTLGGVVAQAVNDVTTSGALYFLFRRQSGQYQRHYCGCLGGRLQ
jgi:hypothetical protein